MKNNALLTLHLHHSSKQSNNSPAILRSVEKCLKIILKKYQISWYPGPQFNIKMTFYLYRKSHCGDKTILRPPYLYTMGFHILARWYLYIESGPCRWHGPIQALRHEQACRLTAQSGLPSSHLIMLSSKSEEGCADGCPIFKWVTVTWLQRQSTRR